MAINVLGAYVALCIPAMLGTLRVLNRILDLYERIEARSVRAGLRAAGSTTPHEGADPDQLGGGSRGL